MKIRKGFVSNSSSSSFILRSIQLKDLLFQKAIENIDEKDLKEMDFPRVEEVAEELVKSQITHYKLEEGFEEDAALYKRKEKAIEKLKKSKNLDYAVFRATNYDCEIYKKSLYEIVVFTCNNEYHAWEDALETLTSKFSDLYIEEVGEDYLDDKGEYFRYNNEDNSDDIRHCYFGSYINYVKMKRDGKKVVVLEEPNKTEIEMAVRISEMSLD